MGADTDTAPYSSTPQYTPPCRFITGLRSAFHSLTSTALLLTVVTLTLWELELDVAPWLYPLLEKKRGWKFVFI